MIQQGGYTIFSRKVSYFVTDRYFHFEGLDGRIIAINKKRCNSKIHIAYKIALNKIKQMKGLDNE
jgi:hypothetical protein